MESKIRTKIQRGFDTGLATDGDLPAILALQKANRAASADGFVTVEHTLPVLREMQALLPHVVARGEDGSLAGYALSMARECRGLLPVLAPMFARLDRLYGADVPFYVMGQVCVAEAFRGSGVFDGLYAQHRAHFAGRFAALITEISVRNPRSLRAHARVGFTEVDRYRDDTDDWVVVALALRA